MHAAGHVRSGSPFVRFDTHLAMPCMLHAWGILPACVTMAGVLSAI